MRVGLCTAEARELLDPRDRVERVALQELASRLDGPAAAAVLVAPVRLELRSLRKIEIEVRRPAGRTRRAGEDDPEDVLVLVLADERAPEEQLGRRLGSEPAADIRRRPA